MSKSRGAAAGTHERLVILGGRAVCCSVILTLIQIKCLDHQQTESTAKLGDLTTVCWSETSKMADTLAHVQQRSAQK